MVSADMLGLHGEFSGVLWSNEFRKGGYLMTIHCRTLLNGYREWIAGIPRGTFNQQNIYILYINSASVLNNQQH